MKPSYLLISQLLLYLNVGCSVPDSAADIPNAYQAFENATKKPAAKTFHEDNWTIIFTTENGDRVYWFLAPDKDKSSPALFKKTIRVKDNKEQETVIVSECEAPKQVCDDLMKQFKTLNEKYK